MLVFSSVQNVCIKQGQAVFLSYRTPQIVLNANSHLESEKEEGEEREQKVERETNGKPSNVCT